VAAALALTVAAPALGDDLYNTIDGTTPATAIDAEAEVMPLASGGPSGTTALRVQARNSSIDGFDGCNLLRGPVTFALTSSNPAVARVEPATVEFSSCTPLNGPVQQRVLTITPVGAGSATITATVLTNPGPGTFNTQPATFRAEVAPPPNSPPTVSVVGVTSGAHYVKGSVPTPVCEVTDAEDGPSQHAPTMSRPAPLEPDGLGERVARCTYTDSRGATAVSSASYFIIDADAPVIRYVLSKPVPASGWHRGEVALDWVVTEPHSPGSVRAEGCGRVWVTADQPATTYTCTAASAGGRASVTSEPIRLDSTAPTVTGTVQEPSVVVDGVTWYARPPAIRWEVTDELSGVLEGSVKATVAVAGEGRNQMARTVATDNTGGTSVHHLNVDASAPVVEARLSSAPAYSSGSAAWFKDSATVDVVARDPDVQPLERGSGLAQDPTGAHEVTRTGVFTVTATDHVGHVGTSGAVPVSIDSTAPVVSVGCPQEPVLKGQAARATWTAGDEPGGSGLRTAATGTVPLDTSSVGTRTLTAPTASDNVGHTSAAAGCTYRVVYAFQGFLAPVDNHGVHNQVKAGSAVPMKFSLRGDQGLGVLSGAPVTTRTACPSGMSVDALEETATSRSGLGFDPASGVYTYVWKTPSTFSGTCQRLTVTLTDGTSHSALFSFTR
jgi:hypothetical protein